MEPEKRCMLSWWKGKLPIGKNARGDAGWVEFLVVTGLGFLRATVPRPDLVRLHTREPRRRASNSCLT